MKRSICRAGALAACLALGACSLLRPSVPPAQLFLFDAAVDARSAEPPASAGRPTSIGLGPIHLPDYLQRPTIVTRTGPTQITPRENDRWAEPLADGVRRVLREDLRRALGVEQVVAFPWYPTQQPAVQVSVDVQQLECDSAGQARLTALWEVRDPTTRAVRHSGETRVAHAVADRSTAACVAALSQALGDLAREAAAAVASAPAPPASR